MNKVLLFAGTTEGRIISEYLKDKKIPATVCVATEYGESLLTENQNLDVLVGRMDKDEMNVFLKKNEFNLVIDATHPYAALVTDNIKAACDENNINYIRLIRESTKEKDVMYFSSIKETIDYLNTQEGNALITTGSKEIDAFINVNDYKKRLIARVLPMADIIKKCTELGFQGKNLICMQGPFSEEMNYLMLKESNSSFLVTKEAGTYGGFSEKVNAAKRAGAKVLVIKRPTEETGLTLEEVFKVIDNIE
jgi:precorrin-6x reductase